MPTPPKVGICHYRIGKTDGVSLEIMKRQRVLTEMGYEVRTIAGVRQTGADYVIPELEYDDDQLVRIRENAFSQFNDYPTEAAFWHEVDDLADKIEQQFLEIQEREHFDVLFLHNIFSFVVNLPATKAFHTIAKRDVCRIVGVHHDFYWDGPNAQRYLPTTDLVRDFVEEYLPPRLPNVSHVVINSLNKQRLAEKCGLDSLVIPDTFNFAQPAWQRDDYNSTFLSDVDLRENDLVVLQATRVVERKAIELAIEFVAALERHKGQLVGCTLYNGKKITEDSRVVLLLSGYTENHSLGYRAKLEAEIKRLGVEARFADYCIDTTRTEGRGLKMYSLWDSYVYADLVTYPSLWEGWGNQFIEAVFAKKPLVIYEYPVFKSDIKPEGYSVITLGDVLGEDLPNRLVRVPDNHLEGAVHQAMHQLIDPKTNELLERNFAIGKQHHDDTVLRELLVTLLEKA